MAAAQLILQKGADKNEQTRKNSIIRGDHGP